MREEFRPAIEALQKDLIDLERKVVETKSMINRLCEAADTPPMYEDVGSVSKPGVSQMRADTFYGKVLTTAAREYLEMRRAANLGPASPREIFEALRQGGFAFETKDDNNAIAGVRQTLRKNSSIFHRLPNGEYGLLAWYPRAKKSKADNDDNNGNQTDADPSTEEEVDGEADKPDNQEAESDEISPTAS